MPRGTRALHEFETSSNTASPAMVAFIPEADWVRCTCWCERHVIAIGQEHVGIRTFSCGASDCRSPDGDATVGCALSETQPGKRAWRPGLQRKPVRVVLRRRLEEIRREQDRYAHPLSAFELECRRQDVLQLWHEGKRVDDIAKELGLRLPDVLDDLKVLRARSSLRDASRWTRALGAVAS